MLGDSRKAIRRLVFQSSSRIWAELHEKAFRRFGGATRAVVLDHLLEEACFSPDIYNPKINPLYRDVIRHYSIVPLPCCVTDPDREGKVESGVGHAQKTPSKRIALRKPDGGAGVPGPLGRALGRYSHPWHHQTTGRGHVRRGAAGLQPLPVEPFRYYQYAERTVHLDGCVEVEAAYYAAPPGWIERRVPVQRDDRQVRVLNPRTGELLRADTPTPCTRGQEEDRPTNTAAHHAVGGPGRSSRGRRSECLSRHAFVNSPSRLTGE